LSTCRLSTQFCWATTLACWLFLSSQKRQDFRAESMQLNPLFKSAGLHQSLNTFKIFFNTIIQPVSTHIYTRLYMEELVHYLERTPKSQRSNKWKQIVKSLPAPLCNAVRPQDWKKIYSMKAINSALAKVRMVGFNEKIVRLWYNPLFVPTIVSLLWDKISFFFFICCCFITGYMRGFERDGC